MKYDQTQAEADLETILAEVVDEITQLLNEGASVTLEEYTSKYPELADTLPRIFEALTLVRQRAVNNPEDPSPQTVEPQGLLGDFRILREIGRGGMGIVYEAEQVSLRRKMALKVLPFAAMLDKQQLKRFKNEARAAATLDHPHIVAVHSVGEERGVHYFAMQLVEGQSLAEILTELQRAEPSDRPELPAEQQPSSSNAGPTVEHRLVESRALKSELEQRPSTRETKRELHAAISTVPAFGRREYSRTIAKLGMEAAEALGYAHQNGIVHRDVKPGNLMVDTQGKLWVTDFGLARIEADAEMTMTGDLLGTLRYMSPEQACGNRTAIGDRSDIYALGATLYELLTLHPAQPATDRQQLLREIIDQDPPAPSRLEPHLPADLDAIILKAIEKDPADRYQSAQAMANDLQSFLDNRPVVARPPSLASRTRKWLRRHRSVVRASLATLFITLLGSAVLLITAYRGERTQRETAERHAQLARQTVDEMLTKVAVTWVPGDPTVSAVQRQFLRRALDIYQQLIQHPSDGNPRSADAALAHERLADIYYHLGRAEPAVDSLKMSLQIRTQLASQDAVGTSHGADLVRCYRKLAQRQRALGNDVPARQATDQGIDLAEQSLARVQHQPLLQRELARLLSMRAAQLLQEGQIAVAAFVAERPEARFIDQLKLTSKDPLDDLVLGAEWAQLRAAIYRRQDRLDMAAEEAREAIAQYSSTRNSMYYDAKRLLELDADLQQNLAETLLLQGDQSRAIAHFRTALGLRGQRLGGRNAAQLGLAVKFDRQQRLSLRDFECLPMASYVETQLRLAALLPSAGRPVEARTMAGEALVSAVVLHYGWPDELRYWVLYANSAALVGDLLVRSNDPEVNHYRQLAALLWKEAQARFPQAERYDSELGQANSDWEQFRTAHPQLASQPPAGESYALFNEPSAFMDHARGQGWFQFEDWQRAVFWFTNAAQLRNNGQAEDWLYLAMAYQHLGKSETAQQFYEQAVAQLQEMKTPSAELESLRSDARQLLDVPPTLSPTRSPTGDDEGLLPSQAMGVVIK